MQDGQPGTLTIHGSSTQSSNSVLAIDVDATNRIGILNVVPLLQNGVPLAGSGSVLFVQQGGAVASTVKFTFNPACAPGAGTYPFLDYVTTGGVLAPQAVNGR